MMYVFYKEKEVAVEQPPHWSKPLEEGPGEEAFLQKGSSPGHPLI